MKAKSVKKGAVESSDIKMLTIKEACEIMHIDKQKLKEGIEHVIFE